MVHMNSYYCFNQTEIKNIINRFGKVFFEKVLGDVRDSADKWALSSFALIPSYSANLVFKCHSESFGNAVLKISPTSSKEFITEFNALKEYDGKSFCKIFDADLKKGVILEERVEPGSTLRSEPYLEKRVSVFSSLYKNMHIAPANSEIYPTYLEWIFRITEYMSKLQNYNELYLHMKKAKELCLSVSSIYPKKLLLHGDFHHDNILLHNNGEYKIIDPKGVVGDPVFDVSRFILNEFSDEITSELYEKIK